jgi:hypothetical protein
VPDVQRAVSSILDQVKAGQLGADEIGSCSDISSWTDWITKLAPDQAESGRRISSEGWRACLGQPATTGSVGSMRR